VAGITLLLGIDRFMSEARSVTNLIGNSIATVVVARWENEFDARRAAAILNGAAPESRGEPVSEMVADSEPPGLG